jgi:hypothetical protein
VLTPFALVSAVTGALASELALGSDAEISPAGRAGAADAVVPLVPVAALDVSEATSPVVGALASAELAP